MAVIYSTSLVDYGMNRAFMVAGIYTYPHRQQVPGKNVAQMARLSSASDNFDEDLMVEYELDPFPNFLSQIISSNKGFSQKSSVYNCSGVLLFCCSVILSFCCSVVLLFCCSVVLSFFVRQFCRSVVL